jgi:hypothetical protein
MNNYRPVFQTATHAALWPLGTERIGMTKESPMMDVVTELKELLDGSLLWFFERSDVMHGVEGELPDEDAKAIDTLKALRDSVDIVPPSLIQTAEELRSSWPEGFEKWLVHGVHCVGVNYFPASATEFVKALNYTVHREATSVRGR